MGAFLQNIFPARQWPLLKDEANTKGFLHRQDLRRSQKWCPESFSPLDTLRLRGTACMLQIERFSRLAGLDVPSSGLILVAKTYAAYFDLRLQLQKGNFDGR